MKVLARKSIRVLENLVKNNEETNKVTSLSLKRNKEKEEEVIADPLKQVKDQVDAKREWMKMGKKANSKASVAK